MIECYMFVVFVLDIYRVSVGVCEFVLEFRYL